jgi:CRISPR-associated protein Cmr4
MSFSTYRYLLMTTDPVHIGTGGMRLGRVDNSIVREPGTRLPKIPGTSLSGAIRSYAAYRYGKRRCAGQGQPQDSREGHCGEAKCPICYTFGSVSGEQSYSGVVSIGDARILLFPVYSMAGPVWVTCLSALEDFGITGQTNPGDKAKWEGITTQGHLNLGWLMVEKDSSEWTVPANLKSRLPQPVGNRIVLISDRLFSQVVNSNLEVRTSVAINPKTGAAEDGALFTYEAIPRAAFLWMDVVSDDFRDQRLWQNGGVISKAYKEEQHKSDGKIKNIWKDNDPRGGPLYPDLTNSGKPEQVNGQPKGWQSSTDVVTSGLEWVEHLGIGGMGTRGFGRVRVLKRCEVDQQTRSLRNCHPLDAAEGKLS